MKSVRNGRRVTVYWSQETWDVVPHPSAKPRGATRIAVVSDTHEKTAHLRVPKCDVLLHAGDFTFTGVHQKVRDFDAWLAAQPSAQNVVIAGNHDITFDGSFYEENWSRWHRECQPELPEPSSLLPHCTYLEDEEALLECGLRIYGSPWQPEFCSWAFNLPRGEECARRWRDIPPGMDIVMTHGPPGGGLGGVCSNGEDAGCQDLLERLLVTRPLLHVSGHIHEDRGVRLHEGIFFINACSVNLRYKPVYPPIIVDIELIEDQL